MRAFTLIELIFVIIIIGVLAAVAVPRFTGLTENSKDAAVKSVISSATSAIENIHGEWVVDDTYVWDPDGDGNSNLNDNGYPISLDSGAGTTQIFSYILKSPIPACGEKKSGCWREPNDNEYEYYYNPNRVLKIKYNANEGKFECEDGTGITASECQQIVFG